MSTLRAVATGTMLRGVTACIRSFENVLGFNWILLVLMLGLMIFGIYAIYSATWMRDDSFWRDQLKWIFAVFRCSWWFR